MHARPPVLLLALRLACRAGFAGRGTTLALTCRRVTLAASIRAPRRSLGARASACASSGVRVSDPGRDGSGGERAGGSGGASGRGGRTRAARASGRGGERRG